MLQEREPRTTKALTGGMLSTFSFQVAEQMVECPLVEAVVFPARKVASMPYFFNVLCPFLFACHNSVV